jgi:enoyl-CoA hydratase/carnithine racemase
VSAGAIHVECSNFVARVTISDVARHNAMSLSMWEALRDAFVRIDADREVRVCVLRGAGDKAFVSGANISEFETQRSSDDAVRHYNAVVARTQAAIVHARVPVIAAISGICYGGGLGLALSCDLRYAAPHSRFRMPAARMGLGYDVENMRSILHNLGPTATAEAFYTARVYDAAQAREMRMVNAVVDDVFAHSEAIALEIAHNAPLTVQAAKQAIVAITDNIQDLSAVHAAVQACFKSKDYAEGRLAFAQKRPPEFTGL